MGVSNTTVIQGGTKSQGKEEVQPERGENKIENSAMTPLEVLRGSSKADDFLPLAHNINQIKLQCIFKSQATLIHNIADHFKRPFKLTRSVNLLSLGLFLHVQTHGFPVSVTDPRSP